MVNLYWNIYQRLEQELVELSDVIFIDDAQINVYSMRIADLLMRTCVEIEAISKKLYVDNGGTIIDEKKMYFDKVCIDLLERKWLLSKKVVFVTCPTLYFNDDSNKILTPLLHANIFGPNSADWAVAYQAIKHSRINNLSQGNIKLFIRALAALYILNLYLRQQIIDLDRDPVGSGIDWGLGSKVFSIKVHPCGNEVSEKPKYKKKEDYDECVYLSQKTDETHQKAVEAMKNLNKYIREAIPKEVEKLLNQKIHDGSLSMNELNSQVLNELKQHAQTNIIMNQLPYTKKDLFRAIEGLRFEAVLNTQQY